MIEPTEGEQQARVDSLIERAAQRIARYRLQAPAVLFLEMHKPLAGIASQATHFLAPLLVPFLGTERIEDLALLLSKGEYVDRLIERVQAAGQGRREEGEDGPL